MKKKIKKLNDSTSLKIEQAVLNIFSKTDFHKANMRQVAQQAGVSFETIYKYYRNKEGLLFHFIKKWLSESISGIDEHLQGIESIHERFRKFTWVQNKYYERNYKVGTIIYLTVPLKTWMEDPTFRHQEMFEKLLTLVKEAQTSKVINPKIPPHIIVDVWQGIAMRTFAMWIYKKRKSDFMRDFNVLFEIFWNGVSAQ